MHCTINLTNNHWLDMSWTKEEKPPILPFFYANIISKCSLRIILIAIGKCGFHLSSKTFFLEHIEDTTEIQNLSKRID